MEGFCTLNTDASVKGNEGGYAIWITTDNERIKTYGKFKQPVSDPNRAEIMAVINGIVLILTRKIPARVLVVNTDNLTCRRIINERGFSPNGFDDLVRHLRSLISRFPKVYAKSIKGHTKIDSARHHVNRWCDEYSRKGRLINN